MNPDICAGCSRPFDEHERITIWFGGYGVDAFQCPKQREEKPMHV